MPAPEEARVPRFVQPLLLEACAEFFRRPKHRPSLQRARAKEKAEARAEGESSGSASATVWFSISGRNRSRRRRHQVRTASVAWRLDGAEPKRLEPLLGQACCTLTAFALNDSASLFNFFHPARMFLPQLPNSIYSGSRHIFPVPVLGLYNVMREDSELSACPTFSRQQVSCKPRCA